MLEEVVPQPPGLPETVPKDCMVQVQDLKCYWDKVKTFLFCRICSLEQPKLPRIGWNWLESCIILFWFSDPGLPDSAEAVLHGAVGGAAGCGRTGRRWEGVIIVWRAALKDPT